MAEGTVRKQGAGPPTGTVTFLFTDIEGSTALWDSYPVQMETDLARHDRILRGTVETHGGHVFKMVGDACCAVFAYPREALRAALAAQRALFAETWSEPISLRVRMALHTGATEERDGDYFGPPVNRVARLLSAGHGGQVLLSGATHNLVRDHPQLVDKEARFLDLGEHRLKDLTHPEQVYQMAVPDLPERFPPLRADKTPDDFENRYRFIKFLGSGGMAKVYLAHDERLRRDVAIKVLHPRYVGDEEFVKRFEREARSAANLSDDPSIVTIYDQGEKRDGTYYIIMEYLPGGTLKDLILREGPLPARTAVGLTMQVAQALEVAHEEGIVHRDIKPQNILLTKRGKAKVADFGIARAASSTTITRAGFLLGTPHYMSPEQVKGEPASPRSDLYALGVVLYEMLTGKLPFDAETPIGILSKHLQEELRSPKEINPNVPERVNASTLRLLARDPRDRYPDAATLIGDFNRALRPLEEDDETVSGQPAPDGGAEEDSAVTVPGETVPPSTVQAPTGDGRAEEASEVATRGATGPSTVEVPALTGKNAFQASSTLADAGLTLGDQREAPSETVPEGEIIEQTPQAGTEVQPDSLVSITLSSGPEEKVTPTTILDAPTRSSTEEEAGLDTSSTGPTIAGSPTEEQRASSEGSSGPTARGASRRSGKPAKLWIGAGLLFAVVVAVGLIAALAYYTTETADFALASTLSGHSGDVKSVAFSPDGSLLASGSGQLDPGEGDTTVKLWDPQTGEELQTLSGHSGDVESVAFSPDGNLLASGSGDGTVKLWDPQSGEELQTLRSFPLIT